VLALSPFVAMMEFSTLDYVDPAVLMLRGLTEPGLIPDLMTDAMCSDYKDVCVSEGGITWKEFGLFVNQKLWSVLCQQPVVDEVHARTGRPITTRSAWLNVYDHGQHIDWHRDVIGDMQLILLLEAPPTPEGQFMIKKRDDAGLIVPLTPGDAVLFCASKIYHRTTPIVTHGLRRVTAVMRFLCQPADFPV
jgi:hypothetical protein